MKNPKKNSSELFEINPDIIRILRVFHELSSADQQILLKLIPDYIKEED